jgi:hypothetical protein
MSQRIGLADVLRMAGPAYLASHTLSRQQAKVWRAIIACRTPALGGHIERCNACGSVRHIYHSCRNRHCPVCQMRTKEAWLAARRQELLPVPYFHVVFTLPHALNGIIGRHARAIYDLLFSAASATLSEFAANPRWLGGTPAFTLVLHTWKQDLGRHVHVHALLAGGALDGDGHWVSPRRGFLFPVRALSHVFRGKFITGLEVKRARGPLHDEEMLAGSSWHQLKTLLFRHPWVVYVKEPLGGPAQVLEYLGRYTHRVAISNERLVRCDAESVGLRVRDRDQRTGRLINLPSQVFIARYLQHVLPDGFKRIRHYGLLSAACKGAGLAQARCALDVMTPSRAVIETVAAFMQRVANAQWERCPHCANGHYIVAEAIAPSWSRPRFERGPP